MKKMVLVDGTNLIFRAYFATAAMRAPMRNSKGLPTNAIYGFISMLNKIMNEEEAEYIVVALDEGKTFRHERYDDYKAGRNKTPDELIVQLPYFKRLLDAMGVKWLTYENYEADDIVGSIANEYKNDLEIVAISGDRDYLQLIDKNVTVKMLKKNEFTYYDEKTLHDEYGITPQQIIDIKALEGDKSDNIAGVAGIGAVGALKLIKEYGSIENIYENIDNITGKIKEKLLAGKEDAFFSKEMVTIYTKLHFELDDLKYIGNTDQLIPLYEELEFHSLIKKLGKTAVKTVDYTVITELDNYLENGSFIHFDYFGKTRHEEAIIGMAITNSKGNFYIHEFDLKMEFEKLFDYTFRTYDYKNIYYYMYKMYGKCFECDFDFMLASYLLDKRPEGSDGISDISTLASMYNYQVMSNDDLYQKGVKYSMPDTEKLASVGVVKSNYMMNTYETYLQEMKDFDVLNLLYDIELPLAKVLAKMEFDGVSVDKNFLVNMSNELSVKIDELEKEIYEIANQEFNISSYIQLGKVLFEDLKIPYPKKLKAGEKYKTNVEILELIKDEEIVKYILEYRSLKKLQSTYLEGLQIHIKEDGKIHTYYNQTLAITGRLSSLDPNIQNIPVRTDLGREIRKAFVASPNRILLTCDYSQIELRILAHLSNSDVLIDAFNNGDDIHAITAAKIYGVDISMVDDTMRRNAKAVNFGIVYGMSEFGLAQTLDIDIFTAKMFITKYFETYAGIKMYLEKSIADASDRGYSKTLFNRIRYINELKTKRQLGERLAMNTPIQGAAADIIKIAMNKIDAEFEKHGIKSKMLLQIHDELIFDVVPEEKEQVLNIVLNEMKNAHYTDNISIDLKVNLDVEYGFGNSWYEAK